MDTVIIPYKLGANQAFMNTALAVLDSGDNVIIVAPYYFSHKLSCQLVAANVTVCPFDPSTFAPNWEALTILVKDLQPRMVSSTIYFRVCLGSDPASIDIAFLPTFQPSNQPTYLPT